MNQPSSHWHNLAQQLGAQIQAEPAPPPAPAPLPPLPDLPPPRPLTPSSAWQSLAQALGISSPPAAEKPATAEAHVLSAGSQFKPKPVEPAQPAPPRASAFPKPAPQSTSSIADSAPAAAKPKHPAAKPARKPEVAKQQMTLPPAIHQAAVDEIRRMGLAEEAQLDAQLDEASTDDSPLTTSAEDETTPARRRRRRRRGKRGRRPNEAATVKTENGEEIILQDEIIHAEMEPIDFVHEEVEMYDEELEFENQVGTVEEHQLSDSDSDEEAQRPTRRRRRRRKRVRGKQPEVATPSDSVDDGEEKSDDADTQASFEGDEGTQRHRRGHRMKSTAKRSEEDDSDDFAETDEELGHKHRNITSWETAIGMIIDANMEARAKDPRYQASRNRQRSRGRGPNSNGSGPRRS